MIYLYAPITDVEAIAIFKIILLGVWVHGAIFILVPTSYAFAAVNFVAFYKKVVLLRQF